MSTSEVRKFTMQARSANSPLTTALDSNAAQQRLIDFIDVLLDGG
jgi:hypothetical protein